MVKLFLALPLLIKGEDLTRAGLKYLHSFQVQIPIRESGRRRRAPTATGRNSKRTYPAFFHGGTPSHEGGRRRQAPTATLRRAGSHREDRTSTNLDELIPAIVVVSVHCEQLTNAVLAIVHDVN